MDIRKTYFKITLIILVVTLISFPFFYEPDIHQATYKELVEITGIGQHKANSILSYLKSNKEAEISDLEDINGIGSILVERIEKVYR